MRILLAYPSELNDHNQTKMDDRAKDKVSSKLSVKGRMYEWEHVSETLRKEMRGD